MKDGDIVVDWDHMQAAFPHMTLDQLRGVRKVAEDAAKDHTGDAWVIRCVADPEKRTELATSLGAEEVVVLETDAETAKANVTKRNRNPEKNEQVFSAIDDWWSQYGVVESHLIVRPDKGHPNSDRKKNMADTENEASGPEDHSDKGFPAQTKIADMTPEQQAAYWKFQSRKHEGNVTNLRSELDKRPAAPKQEKAPAENTDPLDPAELRKQIMLELKKEQAPELVRSQFEALIGDRMPEATRDAILEDLNLARFVKEDGSLDKDRIKAKAELIAPVTDVSNVRNKVRTHQGNRKQERTATVSAGKDLFEEFSKKR
jgi:hypothetical protein